VRRAYLELAKAEPDRITVIDASVELPSVEKQVEAALEALRVLRQWTFGTA